MRRFTLVVAGALFAAACADTDTPTSVAPTDARQAASENAPIYLVTFHDGVDVTAATNDIARGHGLAVRAVRAHAARGFSAVIPPPVAERLRSDPRVALIEKDGPVSMIKPVSGSAKPCWAGGDCGGGGGGGQETPWGVTRVGGAVDGTGKTAWVIDTGIDLAHPDLNTSRNCHANFVTRGKDSPADGNGHGTHVAGTIAAIDNSIDVVGVAPNAYVCAVRVLDNGGSGTWEAVVNGVNYVAANGANGDVANMSLSGTGANATLEQAVRDAAGQGIRFALAAGNDGDFAGNHTPARVDHANVYTISAIGTNDCLTSWSNWGNPPVDFAAPGAGILSTKKGGGTTTMSGTSMAAPHVAGLLLAGNVRANGQACGDPDGNPDAIAHR